MKKKQVAPSAVQTQATQLSTADAAARDKQIAGVNQQQQQAQSTIDAAKPTVQRITTMDQNGSTPLRKALTNSLTSQTTNSYNNALVAARARGLGQGLANQPLDRANQMAVENQRAQALGHIPADVEQQASQEELQAAGLQTQMAGAETGIANTGLGAAQQYNPNAPLQTASGLEQARQQQENYENQQRGGLWKGLARVGLTAAAPFTGGATLPIAGALR